MLMSVHWTITTVEKTLSVKMRSVPINVPVKMDSVEVIAVSHLSYYLISVSVYMYMLYVIYQLFSYLRLPCTQHIRVSV